MQTKPRIIQIALLIAGCLIHAPADLIANWKQLNSSATPTTADMNTDHPVVGDGSDGNVASTWPTGRFGTVATPVNVTLAVGQTLTVSGEVVLSGGGGGDNQYRFGVFNDGGQFAASSGSLWTGGFMVESGTDLYRARTNGPFLSSGGNAGPLTATAVNTGTFSKNSPMPLQWSFAITRDSATTVDLASSLTGGGGNLVQTYTSEDVATSIFTYTATGWLFGGGSSLDQVSFSNVAFNVIPEPATSPLIGIGLLVIVLCRKHLRLR